MSLTTLTSDYTTTANTLQPTLVVERFLRQRHAVWQQIYHEDRLTSLIRQMLLSSAVALAGYGLVLGIDHSWMQAVSSALKMPLLFLLTVMICLPTLYLFNLLYDGRLSVRQVLALALSAVTVTSALTLSFAPIMLFFIVTGQSYLFSVLLNVGILTLNGLIGLWFLVNGTAALNQFAQQEQLAVDTDLPLPWAEELAGVESAAAQQKAAAPVRPRSLNYNLLLVWLGLFAFVGTQLGWTLRPFFGIPGSEFVLFRPIEGDFYTTIIVIVVSLLLGL